MEIDYPTGVQEPQLRALWQLSFGDSEEFIDVYKRQSLLWTVTKRRCWAASSTTSMQRSCPPARATAATASTVITATTATTVPVAPGNRKAAMEIEKTEQQGRDTFVLLDDFLHQAKRMWLLGLALSLIHI